MSREALKLALEVMHNQGDVGTDEWIAAEKAIKEALAQPEQEPVAWWDAKLGVFDEKQFDQLQPLYTSPPQRQPLTDAEIDEIELPPSGTATVRDMVRLIEAALKEKNGN